jgi:hypothetical protein
MCRILLVLLGIGTAIHLVLFWYKNAVNFLAMHSKLVFRTLQDFGDGGAFPEIHLAQYPMNLGKPAESEAKTKSNSLAVQLDATGKVKYDLIARQGHGKVEIKASFNIIQPLLLSTKTKHF